MRITKQFTPTCEPSESLEQAKQRFARWSAGRQRGTHISVVFWAVAIGLIAQHGLRRIVEKLRISIDYVRLTKRFK
jgi:hypothetical protein